MGALHECLDPLVGFSNGYASAFKEVLDAQLFKIAGHCAPALSARLLAGSGEVTSAEQGYRIADLAHAAHRDPVALAWLQRREPAQRREELPEQSPFRRELARFLEDFGHRAMYEADVINPRWHDDPSYILDQVRRMLEAPHDGDPRQAARQVSAVAWAEVKRLTFWRRPLLRWLVGQVQRGFALRESGKSGMVASLWPTRHLVLEIGRRLVAGGHLERLEHAFHLSKADLLSLLRDHWDGGGAGALSHDRMAQRQAWLTSMPPDVLIEGEGACGVVPVQQPLAVFDGQVWRGIGVSSGRVTAVAREYGLPAVVNIPDILYHITDGEVLTVDGDAATVRRITLSPE